MEAWPQTLPLEDAENICVFCWFCDDDDDAEEPPFPPPPGSVASCGWEGLADEAKWADEDAAGSEEEEEEGRQGEEDWGECGDGAETWVIMDEGSIEEGAAAAEDRRGRGCSSSSKRVGGAVNFVVVVVVVVRRMRRRRRRNRRRPWNDYYLLACPSLLPGHCQPADQEADEAAVSPFRVRWPEVTMMRIGSRGCTHAKESHTCTMNNHPRVGSSNCAQAHKGCSRELYFYQRWKIRAFHTRNMNTDTNLTHTPQRNKTGKQIRLSSSCFSWPSTLSPSYALLT